jgi:glycerophosphoryl diester phosphodiesterase
MSRQTSKPPQFPAGGLLSLSTPLPRPEALSVLEGIYDTSSRFGAGVVVHASTWGAAGNVQGSLALLGRDHIGYALLQPGCLADASGAATQLVLEGYWRYLDAPDPDASSTGLVRLFVGPSEAVRYLCGPAGGPAPAPGTATLSGATGAGENQPGLPLDLTYRRARKSKLGPDGVRRFGVGAHHGACQTVDNCGVSENTPETFILSKQLGADYLELDIRVTKDLVPVSFHLGLGPSLTQGVYCSGAVEDFTYAQLVANCRLRNGEVIPRVSDLLEYGLARTDLTVWLDMKTPETVVPTSQILAQLDQTLVPCDGGAAPPPGARCLFPGSKRLRDRVIMGLPDPVLQSTYETARAANQLAPGQLCLIEDAPEDVVGVPCVAWGPRYTRGPMADSVRSLQSQNKFVGYWTINDPATMDAFLREGVPNGILTNYLGLLNQRWEEVGVLPSFSPGSP